METKSVEAVRIIAIPSSDNGDKKQKRKQKTRSKVLPCIDTALHMHLEIESLVREFSRCAALQVPHSGLYYATPDQALKLNIGREARHRCRFRFKFKGNDLGEIAVMRGKRFRRREAVLLDQDMRLLLPPLFNALRYWRAIQASYTDPLTGIYNRSFMDEALHRETGLAHRHANPLSILVLDIDGFKIINDSLGHTAGDIVLKRVARTIAGCLRATDLVARYGGDEFLVILSNTDLSGARTLSKQIMRRLDDAEHDQQPAVSRPTVSIGVAGLQPGESETELFHHADRALYRAKRKGGNRVSAALGRRSKRGDQG